jgi:hypothetical protein
VQAQSITSLDRSPVTIIALRWQLRSCERPLIDEIHQKDKQRGTTFTNCYPVYVDILDKGDSFATQRDRSGEMWRTSNETQIWATIFRNVNVDDSRRLKTVLITKFREIQEKKLAQICHPQLASAQQLYRREGRRRGTYERRGARGRVLLLLLMLRSIERLHVLRLIRLKLPVRHVLMQLCVDGLVRHGRQCVRLRVTVSRREVIRE